MGADETTLAVLAVVFVATLVRSALGFGEALVAVPLLALLIPVALTDDRLAWAFGFVAGVLGGAYGVNGPPLVVYGALRRWPPEQFRATLQGYFLPAAWSGWSGTGRPGCGCRT